MMIARFLGVVVLWLAQCRRQPRDGQSAAALAPLGFEPLLVFLLALALPPDEDGPAAPERLPLAVARELNRDLLFTGEADHHRVLHIPDRAALDLEGHPREAEYL